MDNKKVAFILCTNHEQYLEECVRYIHRLHVPDGFLVDVITIREADSMTKAYNAAMMSSDARYKVYLHQDVFILNRNLIFDMVDIFQNQEIGMIGVIGKKAPLPKDAFFSFCLEIGNIMDCSLENQHNSVSFDSEDVIQEVAFVDGMFMITQYDVPWNEQITGWHFYDASQCIEMQKRGYGIVVPHAEKPWILHDAGVCTTRGYEQGRKLFCDLYREYGFTYGEKYSKFFSRWTELDQKKKEIRDCIENKELEEAREKLSAMKDFYMDKELSVLEQLFDIWEKERKKGLANIFSENLQEEIKKFYAIKFMLLRIDHDFAPEESQELIDALVRKEVSSDAVFTICERNVDISTMDKVMDQIVSRCEASHSLRMMKHPQRGRDQVEN